MCTVLLPPGGYPVAVKYSISYRIYHIISYRIISYIIAYHIVSYRIVSCRIISYHIISYHIISYHIISYIISYHIISYHINSREWTPWQTVQYKNGFVTLLNIRLPFFTTRCITNAPDHTKNYILRYDSDLHCDMDQYNWRVSLHARVNRYIFIMFHNSAVLFCIFNTDKLCIWVLEIPVLICIHYPQWRPIIK
jgi:hypothetical protein